MVTPNSPIPDRRVTSGRWNRDDAPIYFRASLERQHTKSHFWGDNDEELVNGTPALISLWYYEDSQKKSDIWERWLDAGWPLMLDSGVFSLYRKMLARTGRGWADVPASEFVVEDDPEWQRMSDIYDRVFDDRSVTDRVWGMVEVDAGDWGMKRRRRESMEDKYGIGLIPVFHVGSDPWSYLDFLVDRYDRIAVGFIYVQKRDRDRWLLETFDRLDGSDVWIHLLAYSPDQCRTFVPHSMDSTGWHQPHRGFAPLPASLWSDRMLGRMADGFRARRGTQDYRRVLDLALEGFGCQERMMKHRWTTRVVG